MRNTIAGAAGLATLSVSAAARSETAKHSHVSTGINPPAFELDEVTIAELQSSMSSGKYTAHSLTRKYLERIEDIDKHGPAIKSVLEINPEALAIAIQLDRERKAGRVRGPLHGIPVLIKDNIDTHDQMTTTAGRSPGGSIPLQDSSSQRSFATRAR